MNKLIQALETIRAWNSHTSEYAVDYGSNGVRDFYRAIAGQALAEQPAQQEPVATKLESQQLHGFPVSAADFKKLKALPVGTKLYTTPQAQSAQRTVGDAESWDDRYGTGGSYGVGGCYGPAAFTDGDPNDGY